MIRPSRTLRQPQAAQAPPGPVFPAIPKDTVLPRLAALQTASIADLKEQWRTLFGKEPPPFSRSYITSRLAYRIQELAYGGLKPEPHGSRRSASSSTAATWCCGGSVPTAGRCPARGCCASTTACSTS